MTRLTAPPLLAAMLAAQAGRRAGVFNVSAAGVTTHVFFSQGNVVFADQGTLGDTLGRILLRDGLLTSDQYAAALDYMTRRLIDPEPMRFGEALVELGVLDTDQVTAALAAQVRRKVTRCLMYEAPQWTFQPADRFAGTQSFPCRVEPLLVAAVRLFADERIERILQACEGSLPPRLPAEVQTLGALLELSRDEIQFLALVDSKTSARDLLRDRRASSVAAEALLASVLLLEAARHGRPPLAHLPPRPATVPPRVTTPVETGGLDPDATQLVAEGAFQRAKRHLDMRAPSRALPELRRAANLCPDVMEYSLYLRWAELLINGDEGARPAMQSLVFEIAAKAVSQDPTFAFGYFVLGQLALLDPGDGNAATRLLRHARKLDPSLEDAEQSWRLTRNGAEKVAFPSAPDLPIAGVSELSMLDVIAAAPASAFPPSSAMPRPPAVPPSSVVPHPPVVPKSIPPGGTPFREPYGHVDKTPGPSSSIMEIPTLWSVRRAASIGVVVVITAVGLVVLGLSRPHGPQTSVRPVRESSQPSAVAIPTTAPPSVTVQSPSILAARPPAPSAATLAWSPGAAPHPAAPAAAAAGVDPRFGQVLTPAASRGHRIFIDGKVAGQAPTPLFIPCGPHVVKVGSAGRPKDVLVVCGGTTTVRP